MVDKNNEINNILVSLIRKNRRKERLRVYSRPFHLEKIFSGRFTIQGKPAIRAASWCSLLRHFRSHPAVIFATLSTPPVYPRVPYLGQAEMNLPYACSLDGKNYLASHTFLEVLLELEATIVFIFHPTFTCIWGMDSKISRFS
jgi:hypothetical protein